MTTTFLILLCILLTALLALSLVYYNFINKCECSPVQCPPVSQKNTYRLDMYTKDTVLHSLNQQYRLMLENEKLSLIYIDVSNKDIKTLWESKVINGAKYITCNDKGQLCVKDVKDSELWIYPGKANLATYSEYYVVLSNEGNLVFQDLIKNHVFYIGVLKQ